MSIIQRKQQEQGAKRIVTKMDELLTKSGFKPVTITWDLGKLNLDLEQHTLTALVENGIVKEVFTAKQLEDCYALLRPPVEDALNAMVSRLVQQVHGH